MTHAVLLVTYTGDRVPQTVKVESADQLANRLDDLRGNPRVEEIAVYTLDRRIRAERVWLEVEPPKARPSVLPIRKVQP